MFRGRNMGREFLSFREIDSRWMHTLRKGLLRKSKQICVTSTSCHSLTHSSVLTVESMRGKRSQQTSKGPVTWAWQERAQRRGTPLRGGFSQEASGFSVPHDSVSGLDSESEIFPFIHSIFFLHLNPIATTAGTWCSKITSSENFRKLSHQLKQLSVQPSRGKDRGQSGGASASVPVVEACSQVWRVVWGDAISPLWDAHCEVTCTTSLFPIAT